MAARKQISLNVVSGSVRVLDILIVLAGGWIAHALYPPAWSMPTEVWGTITIVMALVATNIFSFAKVYHRRAVRGPLRGLVRALVGWIVVFACLTTALFVTKSGANISRGWALLWVVSVLVLLSASRLVLLALVYRWRDEQRLLTRVAVYGAGARGREFIEAVESQRLADIAVVGLFDDHRDVPPKEDGAEMVLGGLDDLIAFARRHHLNQIVIALPRSEEEEISRVLRKLRVLPLDIRLATEFVGIGVPFRSIGDVAGVPVINVLDRPIGEWSAITKEIEDRLLGSLFLILSAPIFVLCAALIKLDSPGPVFFSQIRLGYNNRPIKVFKFRTMYHHQQDATGTNRTRPGDHRVTRVGAFLRRSSLDELPQLINVLLGQMSLVGPRPHVESQRVEEQLYGEIIAEYSARHRVKPGITGWAQINGWRGEVDTLEKAQKRIDHDLYYIENWSVAFDLKIILLTFIAVLRGENAY